MINKSKKKTDNFNNSNDLRRVLFKFYGSTKKKKINNIKVIFYHPLHHHRYLTFLHNYILNRYLYL